MEKLLFINEFYPLSTRVNELTSFKKDRAKEIKQLTEGNVELDGVYAVRKFKVLKVTKAKLEKAEDKGREVWHFSCKALLRIENADSN